EGMPILLDATERDLPYTILPMRCLNEQGLLISSITPDWIDIATKAKSKTTVSAQLALAPSGALKGKLEFTLDGYEAFKARQDFRKKGEEDYLKKFFQNQSWEVTKTDIQNVQEPAIPLKQVHEVTLAGESDEPNNIIYINPFVAWKAEDNPFK